MLNHIKHIKFLNPFPLLLSLYEYLLDAYSSFSLKNNSKLFFIDFFSPK